jgi:hypothetical protein
MSRPRYLTKSRYKLGRECPTKLYYTRKDEYPNSKLDDPFLEALADGGYQVGELAKQYFPGGHDINTLDYEEAEAQTNELLKQENVVIFEPAIRYKNLFIRIDILVKQGNHFDLIEVKAKSYDSHTDSFIGTRGGLNGEWAPYLFDVAFQNHVLANAYPDAEINNYLLLADKNAKCRTDGLNQKFRITRDVNNRKGVAVHHSLTDKDLSYRVLTQVPVDDVVDHIQSQSYTSGRGFSEEIQYLANSYENDDKIQPVIGRHCKDCEFICKREDEEIGKKNGFKECWIESNKWSDQEFDEPNILEIWNLNYRTRDKLFEEGKIKISEVSPEDLNTNDDDKPGLSRSQRQWLQIEKLQNDDTTPYFDADGMKAEVDTWTFPLHFIDFETTMVALPFNNSRKPYEGIAFQYSHHMVHQDGMIEHAGQYINIDRGVFPNFDFIRSLKAELENDDGTIFRYANHENNFLNLISGQIQDMADEIDDADELIAFIKSITHSPNNSDEVWRGERDMVDMLELVKRYYYDPAMKGSNSLKAVLPAILNSSIFLRSKYSHPIYGTPEIPSLNFPASWQWVETDGDIVKDPYKKLPRLFQDISDKNMDILSHEDELANGGAAMTAYARMQFADMSDEERNELTEGLLRYCELDTFAMVMLYEAWLDMIIEH